VAQATLIPLGVLVMIAALMMVIRRAGADVATPGRSLSPLAS
jgi:hypothetical protein